MASARYTLNITPDPPEEPPHEMTSKEKRENFWFYYKWHVIIGVVILVIAVMTIKDVLTRENPDYTIGVLTQDGLPVGMQDVLKEQLAVFFDDRNGDGRVSVTVQDYAIPLTEDGSGDPYSMMAGVTRLMGDLQTHTAVIFLTDEASMFSEQYGVFAKTDGTLAEAEVAVDADELGPLWSECPALAALELGEVEVYEGASIDFDQYIEGFRVLTCYLTDSVLEDADIAANYEGSMAAYAAMTAQ